MKQFFKNIALLIGGFFKKYAFTLGIFIVLIVVLIEYIKSLLNLGGFDLEKDATEGFHDNVDVSYSSGISRNQANIYAMQLLAAFNSYEPVYGTDEKVVLDVFKRITPLDFKKIYKEFGQRDYNGYNSPPQEIFWGVDSYDKRNLVYWLRSEIDPEKDVELYSLVKHVVNKAGFVF
ncbi:hypothetical protein [Tenacibaculum ovolyticum]|uniref:hypothetical protein n=1 Tax=Tenacibaculum ovolyticum TaxID=104270 RepID=UPI001F3C816F|nr:hypothetical protein [Tenacibaculum ovolyticum]